MRNLLMEAGAVFDVDRVYRYQLERKWFEGRGKVGFVMFNPSTADEHFDDPTINRCRGFARQWGYQGMKVGNLFALRSTDWTTVLRHRDPVGPDNDLNLRLIMEEVDLLVFAWGAMGAAKPVLRRADAVVELAENLRKQPFCLGKTQDGCPCHPLYLSNSKQLEAF